MPEPPRSLVGQGRNGGPRIPARVSRGQGHRRDTSARPASTLSVVATLLTPLRRRGSIGPVRPAPRC